MVKFLYLYSFVYLRQNKSSSLLVNIYNKEKVFTSNELVNSILHRVGKNKLTYNGCVLTKKECLCPEVREFLKNIIDYSFGGLIEVNRDELPVQFPAEIFVKNYTEKDKYLALSYDIKDRKISKK